MFDELADYVKCVAFYHSKGLNILINCSKEKKITPSRNCPSIKKLQLCNAIHRSQKHKMVIKMYYVLPNMVIPFTHCALKIKF